MKAALSNQNDMRLVATALSGVVGQTTTAGLVPADTQAVHTHLLSWPNHLHPDALWVYVWANACGASSDPSLPQACINPPLHS